jgi:hypothetical protein
MSKKFQISLLFILIFNLFGCLSATTNSSPKFSEDFGKVTEEIKNLSNSESVEFVDMVTMNWNNDIIARELRIDLVKPKQFPEGKDFIDIILAIKPKLIDSSTFTKYTINEVEDQYGQTIVFPAEKILKSKSINVEDL